MAATTIKSNMIEGTIEDTIWFHYDLDNDVLYMRYVSMEGHRAFGEETDEGFTEFYTEDDRFVGMTIIYFWKQFGKGALADASHNDIRAKVEWFACEHLLNRIV